MKGKQLLLIGNVCLLLFFAYLGWIFVHLGSVWMGSAYGLIAAIQGYRLWRALLTKKKEETP